jgi:hypothetical protein
MLTGGNVSLLRTAIGFPGVLATLLHPTRRLLILVEIELPLGAGFHFSAQIAPIAPRITSRSTIQDCGTAFSLCFGVYRHCVVLSVG